MNVRSTRHQRNSRFPHILAVQPLSEDLGALHRAALAILERLTGRKFESNGLGGDHMHEGAALLAREYSRVELAPKRGGIA